MSEHKLNSTRFLDIYNELDVFMKQEITNHNGEGHVAMIKKMAKNRRISSNDKDDLIFFATSLRNTMIHNTYKGCTSSIIEPHDYIVSKYDGIKNKIKNPPIALDIAIKAEDIFTTTMKSVALDVMKEMNKNTYTHVPVFENERIIGVFSENSVFSYMVKNEDVLIEKDVKIEEFIDFIPLEKHESEFFEFVPKNKLVIDIEEMFQKELINRKRLSVVFITESGKPTEKILGIITAWDVAGYKE